MLPEREAIRIGPIVIHWYGIMIMLGVLAGALVAYREARRRREDPEHVWGLFPWALIAGILGARVAFVIANLGDPRYHDIRNIIAIWEGGLSMHGVIIGGVLAFLLYCWRYRLSVYRWFDIAIPGVALGQAIGRWGNYFNQEAFGEPTTLPWGIPISVQRQQEVAGRVYGENVRFHPTFAYEMLWDLINFGVLMWLGRQKKIRLVEGDLMWVYLIFYSIGRFAIESLRVDSAMMGDIKIPQLASVVALLVGWGMIIWRHRPGSNARPSLVNLPEEEQQRLLAATRTAQPQSRPAFRVRRVPVNASRAAQDVPAETANAHPRPHPQVQVQAQAQPQAQPPDQSQASRPIGTPEPSTE